MQNNNERMVFVINQSAILGLIQVFFLVVLYFSGKLFSNWDNISYLISIAFVYWSSIKYRDKFFEGFIRYGKAFNYGLKIMVLSGIIIGFFYFIMLKLDSETSQEQIYTMLEVSQQIGYPDSQLEYMETALLKYYPWMMFFGTVFSCFLSGLLVSLLTSIFVKRHEDPFQEAMKELNEN